MRIFLSNSLGWLPWVGVIVVLGVLGGILGLAGVIGHPTTVRTVVASSVGLTRTATAYACPGGPAIDALEAGDKVLAVERSDDSAYLGVRDPLNVGREVWLRTGDVTVNPHEHSVASLPVGACPEVNSILMPPTNQQGGTVTAPTKPVKPVKPPAPDTTAPTLGTPTAGTPIVCIAISDPPHTDTISVTAADNVGVTAVAITWSGAATGSGAMTRSGATWTYVYDAGSSTAAGTITFQLQARDAAGNLSAANKVSITQAGCVH